MTVGSPVEDNPVGLDNSVEGTLVEDMHLLEGTL